MTVSFGTSVGCASFLAFFRSLPNAVCCELFGSLWGADGQAKLEKSHFCLLGAGPEGTETLKNLVLPGTFKPELLRFPIVDLSFSRLFTALH